MRDIYFSIVIFHLIYLIVVFYEAPTNRTISIPKRGDPTNTTRAIMGQRERRGAMLTIFIVNRNIPLNFHSIYFQGKCFYDSYISKT